MKRKHASEGDGVCDGEEGDADAGPASKLAQYRFAADSESRFKSPAKRSSTSSVESERSLPPLLPADTAVPPQFLVLGSAPSVESLSQQRYYAHRFNHFWPVVARVFNIGCSVDVFVGMEYVDRVAHLCGAGVVVWDMCKEFVRPGSSDSKLTCKQVNDISSVLQDFPSINVVGLNGMAAFKLFQKHVVKAGKLPRPIKVVCLPSTSPLNAMKNAVEVKASKWRKSFGLENDIPADDQLLV